MTITETTTSASTEQCPAWCQSRHPGDELHMRGLGEDAEALLGLDLVQEDGQPARVNVWISHELGGSWPADPDKLGAAASALIAAAASLRNYGIDGAA